MWNDTRTARRRPAPPSAGVTLVELIVAIVIVAIALGGLVAAFRIANRGSADPLILQQKVAIAESLMGEILLKPYSVTKNPVTPNVRDNYLGTMDFDGYGAGLAGIRDVDNNPIAGLQSYNVAVAVSAVTLPTNATSALKITVSVSYAADSGPQDAFVLTGWRTPPQ